MTCIVRFAPSPTGRIHIGNARTALMNALVARKLGGRFILRFDDTDLERSTEAFAASIDEDVRWLGIVPDQTIKQSLRFDLYDAAATRLKNAKRLYPCYETTEELERRRKRQQARGLPPIYDRAALDLSDEERARLEAEGRRPHWRFLLDRIEVAWDDGIRGAAHIDCASLSDPVLIREDGSYLYTLPSVVDDIDRAITHIIRGEDHVTNTAVQIQLFTALGGTIPSFAHHNLLTTASGEGLSKRSGALSIGSLREEGIESLAVAALAVLTGTSEAVQPVDSLDALGTLFDLPRVSRNPARFDPVELSQLSARTLHHMPFETVVGRLAARGIDDPDAAAFWLAVRGNLEKFGDVDGWWDVVDGVIEPQREDVEFLDRAAMLLPPEPWDATTWSVWTTAVKGDTGHKGKALFHPLRLALTGRETGPELAALLPLIGRVKAAGRLAGQVA